MITLLKIIKDELLLRKDASVAVLGSCEFTDNDIKDAPGVTVEDLGPNE